MERRIPRMYNGSKRKCFFAAILSVAAILHSSGLHNHPTTRIPYPVRLPPLGSFNPIKQLTIDIGDSLDFWADEATVRA